MSEQDSRRLAEIDAKEVSIVDHPAIRRKFLVVKRGEPVADETQKGSKLAALLERAVESKASEDMPRADLIDRMGVAAGVDGETVNEIINNTIECPPETRLSGFAEVLDVSLQSLKDAAEEDGCEFDSEEKMADEAQTPDAEAEAATPAENPLSKAMQLLQGSMEGLGSIAKALSEVEGEMGDEMRKSLAEALIAQKSAVGAIADTLGIDLSKGDMPEEEDEEEDEEDMSKSVFGNLEGTLKSINASLENIEGKQAPTQPTEPAVKKSEFEGFMSKLEGTMSKLSGIVKNFEDRIDDLERVQPTSKAAADPEVPEPDTNRNPKDIPTDELFAGFFG